MKYQAPLNGVDENSSYINAVVQSGVEGSMPPAQAFEQPQREILAVIAAAGLTPNGENLGQLLEAIVSIVTASGVSDYYTQAEIDAAFGNLDFYSQATVDALVPDKASDPQVLALTDDAAYVSAAGLSALFARSFGTNGYVTLPGGLLLQWGLTGTIGSESNATVTFGVAHVNDVYFIVAESLGAQAGTYHGSGVVSKTLTQFVLRNTDNNGSTAMMWFSIGR